MFRLTIDADDRVIGFFFSIWNYLTWRVQFNFSGRIIEFQCFIFSLIFQNVYLHSGIIVEKNKMDEFSMRMESLEWHWVPPIKCVVLYNLCFWTSAKMKRLIFLLVVILHSIRFYNDYRSSYALIDASTAENTYFFSNRYFQFEKGKFWIWNNLTKVVRKKLKFPQFLLE